MFVCICFGFGVFVSLFVCFERERDMGFYYVAPARLELTVSTRLASNL